MAVKVAINGFGRIGRLVLRAIVESGRHDVEVVAINDLGPVATNAHLLRHDSVHGHLPHEVRIEGNAIDFGRGPVPVSAHRDPHALNWHGVDLVMECTGVFTDADKARVHLDAGARRVLVSAPSKGADRTVVFKVNHHTLRAGDRVISNGSCTTNCLAPVAHVLDEAFGIESGFMTTIHSYTGDQPTLDTMHKDLYRARAAALSQIPTSTGAAKALGLVLPNLEGKLDGAAIRVPTPNVSCVDLTARLAKHASAEAVNAALQAAAEGALAGILGYTTEPLVSIDFNHDPRSSVVAADQTRALPGNLVRLLAWYDNEWGFSNRMVDIAAEIGKLD